MRAAFYCRIGGQGYGFLLPEEADKLREFFAEYQDKPALEKPSSASKIFCRELDIRVPEIVIPDLSHSLCLEQFRKTLCDVVGLDQIANLIDTYILKIFLDVAASAQAAVFLLFFFQRKKSFPHERNKRQCPHTRFGLCGVRRNQNALAVKITGSNRMTNGDGVLVKVYGIPFQTDCFTPA